jgi:hypothetical protein
MIAASALWIAMPAVTVWAEPPAMHASGRSDAEAVPRIWRMIGGVVFGFGAKSLFIAEANRHDACHTRISDARALHGF